MSLDCNQITYKYILETKSFFAFILISYLT